MARAPSADRRLGRLLARLRGGGRRALRAPGTDRRLGRLLARLRGGGRRALRAPGTDRPLGRLGRVGTALLAPRTALARADDGDGRSAGDAALLIAVGLVVLHGPALVAAGWTAVALGAADGASELVNVLGGALAADLTFLLVGGAAVTLLAGRRRDLGRDLDLACVAYLPLGVVRLAGALLAWLTGWGAPRALTDGAGLVGYGWASVILVLAVAQARRRDAGQPAPEPAPGRAAAVPWVGRAVAALILALGVGQGLWVADNLARLRPIAPGDPAPAFTLPRLDGTGELGLATLADQVVLVDFWATWCGPCRDSMPAIERVYRRLGPRGFEVVSVNTEGWPAAARARALVARLGVTFPVVVDDGSAGAAYKVSTIPHLLLIDRAGRVRVVHRGLSSAARLERDLTAQVDRLLAE